MTDEEKIIQDQKMLFKSTLFVGFVLGLFTGLIL